MVVQFRVSDSGQQNLFCRWVGTVESEFKRLGRLVTQSIRAVVAGRLGQALAQCARHVGLRSQAPLAEQRVKIQYMGASQWQLTLYRSLQVRKLPRHQLPLGLELLCMVQAARFSSRAEELARRHCQRI